MQQQTQQTWSITPFINAVTQGSIEIVNERRAEGSARTAQALTVHMVPDKRRTGSSQSPDAFLCPFLIS